MVPSGSWWFLAIIGVFSILLFFCGFDSSGQFLIIFLLFLGGSVWSLDVCGHSL